MGASISLNSSMLLAVLNRSFSFDAGCPAARWFAGSCAQGDDGEFDPLGVLMTAHILAH